MPRIKPNERCPCGSGLKYKKCCSAIEQQEKQERAQAFMDMLSTTGKGEITSERLLRINTYFLDRYGLPSIDISDIVTGLNCNKIHSHYKGKSIVLMIERNSDNDSVFTNKGSTDTDDIMIIYRNNFLAFNYDQEYDEAIDAIHKWI